MKIYILQCENNKYYVGKTTNKDKRIIEHFTSKGSKWTQKYKPIKIIEEHSGDEFDEEKHTLLMMNKYGIDNVRGGSYCKVILQKHEIEKAQQTINSLLDNCYKCGEKGHFSKKCPTNIKYTNKVETDVETDVNWDDDFCLSCGGSGIAGDGVQCWFCDEDDI